MLEDLAAIQSRVSEIQSQISALSAQTGTTPALVPGAASDAHAATFGQTLQRVQNADTATTVSGAESPETNGIAVPPASLGALPVLPALPVMPDASHLVPLTQTGTAQYDGLINTYAAKNGLQPSLVRAVIQTESGGNAKAVSHAGAMGLMQLMPSNVSEAGISNPFDPEQNIAAGTKQLSDLLKEYGGDLRLALAGYNAGPGNVRKYGGVPPFAETQSYIRKIQAAMDQDGG